MIQKLLIYDKGIGHIGKSRSVKAVFHRLMAEHRGDITEIYVRHGSIRFEDRRDLCVLFKYRGIRVGLESQGDPDCRLVDSLKEFSKQGGEFLLINGDDLAEVYNFEGGRRCSNTSIFDRKAESSIRFYSRFSSR